ncbi:MAG: UDP-N-acetylmuramate--alanine ligase [Deltaproteobacteria bacterium]|nr:UDP-N-acetylmuramate--alanine ligase [Deltaproteobacteria bacterium]
MGLTPDGLQQIRWLARADMIQPSEPEARLLRGFLSYGHFTGRGTTAGKYKPYEPCFLMGKDPTMYPKKYYFSGIGGSGMSALAQILRARGHRVSGSDRTHDRGGNRSVFKKLAKQGIVLLPQKGASVSADVDFLVVSSAIEPSSPERSQAHHYTIPVIHRSQLLADLFNPAEGIGIAGTSGKSTVCGMVASILDADRRQATVINGGNINQYISATMLGNARPGEGPECLAELDESDGSISRFFPAAGLITNISKDHKPLSELRELFQRFIEQTRGPVVLNADCPESARLSAPGALTFGIDHAADYRGVEIRPAAQGMCFTVDGALYAIRQPGRHNVANALAAIALCAGLGVPVKARQLGLQRFKGIQRRLSCVGMVDSITVWDDFAHNPDKLRASLRAIRPLSKRMLIVFQPHGFGPTRFMLDELARAFSEEMRTRDILAGLPIFDAGGTADRSISTADLLHRVSGPRCLTAVDRAAAVHGIISHARSGDAIAVMGARDDSLSAFARSIVRALRRRAK